MSRLTKMLETLNRSGDETIWSSISNYSFPTGLTIFDFMSAMLEKDGNGNYSILNGGFGPQAFSIVGPSSSGKSSLLLQLIAACTDYANMIWPGKSEMVLFDVERYWKFERIKMLTGWTDQEIMDKLIMFQDDKTNVIDIYNVIKQICESKEKDSKNLKVKTPLHNIDGTEHYQYAPTFVIIDSIAMLTSIPEVSYDKQGNIKYEEEISKNTEAMTDAKNNTNFIKKVKPLCSKYGIILVMINHITDEIKISMFDIPTKQLPFLKPGQKITGGKELIYQSAGLIGLLFGEKLDEKNRKYGEDIHGGINKLIFYKNKNGIEGVSYPIVQNATMGYMHELSDFELLTEKKYGLKGVGTYTLDIMPELGSITKKNCYDRCQEDSFVARCIQFTAKVYLAYTLMYKTDPPDLSLLLNDFDYIDRVKIVLTYTDPYPRYKVLDKYMEEKYRKIISESIYPANKAERNFFGLLQERAVNWWNGGYLYYPENRFLVKGNYETISTKSGDYLKLKNSSNK